MSLGEPGLPPLFIVHFHSSFLPSSGATSQAISESQGPPRVACGHLARDCDGSADRNPQFAARLAFGHRLVRHRAGPCCRIRAILRVCAPRDHLDGSDQLRPEVRLSRSQLRDLRNDRVEGPAAEASSWPGRRAAPSRTQLPLQAALLYLAIGPSRLSALTLSFAYFALFQAVLAGTVRRTTGRWSAAFLALGILLAARTTFLRAGGIMDFRIDFTAACLYGTFLCAVSRSEMFRSWGWSVGVGAVATLLILFRFVTAPYPRRRSQSALR